MRSWVNNAALLIGLGKKNLPTYLAQLPINTPLFPRPHFHVAYYTVSLVNASTLVSTLPSVCIVLLLRTVGLFHHYGTELSFPMLSVVTQVGQSGHCSFSGPRLKLWIHYTMSIKYCISDFTPFGLSYTCPFSIHLSLLDLSLVYITRTHKV